MFKTKGGRGVNGFLNNVQKNCRSGGGWHPLVDGGVSPALPHKKQALPRPVKLTITAGQIDTPFQYAHKLCLRGRKSRKICSFDFLYRICTTDCDYFLHRNAF